MFKYRCESPKCTEPVFYCRRKAKIPTWCATHCDKDDKRITGSICIKNGCDEPAIYCRLVGRYPTKCQKHYEGPKRPSVKCEKLCEIKDCPFFAIYGDGVGPKRCTMHQYIGDKKNIVPKCQHDGCANVAKYGGNFSYCALHKGSNTLIKMYCPYENCTVGYSHKYAYCMKHRDGIQLISSIAVSSDKKESIPEQAHQDDVLVDSLIDASEYVDQKHGSEPIHFIDALVASIATEGTPIHAEPARSASKKRKQSPGYSFEAFEAAFVANSVDIISADKGIYKYQQSQNAVILIDVDPDQRKAKAVSKRPRKEAERLKQVNEAYRAIGYQYVTYIKYNPSEYVDNMLNINKESDARHAYLANCIKAQPISSHAFTVMKLFFDQC